MKKTTGQAKNMKSSRWALSQGCLGRIWAWDHEKKTHFNTAQKKRGKLAQKMAGVTVINASETLRKNPQIKQKHKKI